MEEKFIKFIAEIMNVDIADINFDTTYKEYIKWDSMMFLRIIMEIEEEYGVQIPIEQASSIKKIADLYQYVEGT